MLLGWAEWAEKLLRVLLSAMLVLFPGKLSDCSNTTVPHLGRQGRLLVDLFKQHRCLQPQKYVFSCTFICFPVPALTIALFHLSKKSTLTAHQADYPSASCQGRAKVARRYDTKKRERGVFM